MIDEEMGEHNSVLPRGISFDFESRFRHQLNTPHHGAVEV